jgi:hypothetical protein
MFHTDQMRVDPAYRDALRATGLATVEDVLTRIDGRVCAWSRTTDTLNVSSATGGPGFFVKRCYYHNWYKRARGMFRGTFFGPHRGRAEYDLLNEMRQLGISAVRPVAHGCRRVGHFVTACFLITEEAPEARNLTAYARDIAQGRVQVPPARRRAMVVGLARQIAEIHAAGFEHGQLFWRNVLVRSGPMGDAEYFFLDARPRRGRRRFGRSSNWWLEELGHLAASARPFTTRMERMRFLAAYYGARQLTPERRAHSREIEKLAARWRRHEAQRIKMSDLFENWNRQLRAECQAAGELT